MRNSLPPAVEVPTPDRDRPAWVKVGIIAAVGFVLGIAWPRVMGVKLGPSAPGESSAASSGASASHGARAPEAPPASVVVKTPPSAAPPAAPSASATPTTGTAALPPNVGVQKGTVVSCKTTDGETKKGKECGSLAALDLVVNPRLKKLATCSGMEGQNGKLSILANVDFGAGRFSYEIGKSSTLSNLESATSCLKSAFHGTSVTSVSHEHARYTVAYTATLTSGGDAQEDKASAHKDKDKDKDKAEKADAKAKAKEPSEDANETPAPSAAGSGEASVAWEVALVRDAPKTGTIVGRLPRGTKVKVGSARDGWFAIKFGDGFASDGWVYRSAIGR